MKLYNSLSRKKENLPKSRSNRLRLFVCGPTTYDDAHIGHARTYIFFDFFAKYLRSRGVKLKYVQNITNIDDKIINRARQEKKDPLKLADYFTKRYLQDMKSLGISSVDAYAPATKFIPAIVKQVQTLIKKGYAYEIPGDGWYYDVSKFREYGKLSGRSVKQAEDAVSRIDESLKKRNRADFCLWKYSPPKADRQTGEPAWQTTLGLGRPGWHIEDTAISEKFFGPQYELHGGGLDLKFPHHEAEIAQQEAASGKKPFVRIWMHVGMLNVEGKKMAKSLKNFITIREFLKKHSAQTLRLIFLKHHYRKPVDYREEIAHQAEADERGLGEFLEKLRLAERKGNNKSSGKKVEKLLRETEKKFTEALEDDFNTLQALAHIFELVTRLEKQIWFMSRREAKTARVFIEELLGFTGLSFKRTKVPDEVKGLIRQRELFRDNKQFSKADALRKRIQRVGYEIEDTPLGPHAKNQNKNSAAGLRS